MERVDEQGPRLAKERTWGGNEFCFACASSFIIMSLMSGALFAYAFSVTHNIYFFIALMCSSSMLPASLYSAVHFARKPAGFVGPDHRRNQDFFRMRVVRPQDVQDYVEVECAHSSEAHVEESLVPGTFLVLPVICVFEVDLDPVGETAAPKCTRAERISSADAASSNVQMSIEDEFDREDVEQQAEEPSGSRDSTPQSAEELVVEESRVRLRKFNEVLGQLAVSICVMIVFWLTI